MSPRVARPSADAQVRTLAGAYLNGFFERNPDVVTLYGVQGRHYDKLSDRLGMLSSQALRAARLVVDSGLHTLGWTRQQASDYMPAHTAEPKDDVASDVDWYIIYAGQATADMLGSIEIRAARDAAKQTMGTRSDIKQFHDRVLEDGAVPVSFLREKIRAWGQST